jgi:membrane protease YdiL (CAAX protease family)
MRAIKTAPPLEGNYNDNPTPSDKPQIIGDDARLSLRLVTLIEITSVIGSVLLIVWAIAPLFPQTRWLMIPPGIFAFSLILYSHHIRRESWSEIGFTSRHFRPALRLLATPVLIGGSVLMLFGYFQNSFHRSTHFELNLIVVPAWGIVQQYVLQGYVYRRVRQLLVHDQLKVELRKRRLRLSQLSTAGLFALVHLPNLTLTLLTFLAAVIWSWVYERAPNLWALGLSHGLLSLMLMHSSPTWLLQSMSVGYKHFLYQKF